MNTVWHCCGISLTLAPSTTHHLPTYLPVYYLYITCILPVSYLCLTCVLPVCVYRQYYSYVTDTQCTRVGTQCWLFWWASVFARLTQFAISWNFQSGINGILLRAALWNEKLALKMSVQCQSCETTEVFWHSGALQIGLLLLLLWNGYIGCRLSKE